MGKKKNKKKDSLVQQSSMGYTTNLPNFTLPCNAHQYLSPTQKKNMK